MKVLDADTDISTISLFEIGDVCVTVRGTVGMEAACFGLTTVTAGTGRYDRLGFTTDPDRPEAFREILRHIGRLEKPSASDRARPALHPCDPVFFSAPFRTRPFSSAMPTMPSPR